MAADVARVLAICEAALGCAPAGRPALLDSACGADEELRRAVEAVLAEEPASTGFLARPAWAPGTQLILPGTRLGPYEVIAAIGSGAMGEVYKARDTRLERTVAIKVLLAEFAADPVRRARFAREGRAASALNHPHICTIHDVGREGGIDYLVMEYLEGETLAARLARGLPSTAEGLQYACEVADALAHAHASGFVHRDLKPSNVMLTAAGAKLLDFGIARANVSGSDAPTDDPSLTGDGHIIGTIAYMAPELLRGAKADARSDVFAFGAVLYELFTGRRAFQGESATHILAAVLQDEPPAVSTVQPAVPSAIDPLVRQCLAKNPDERCQRVEIVAAELRRIQATHVSRTPEHVPRRTLSRLTGGSIALLVVLVAVLGGWFVVRGRRPVTTRPAGAAASAGFVTGGDVLLTAVTHEPGAESFPTLSPDGREFLYSTGPLDFVGESDIYRRDIGFDRAFNLTPDSPGADLQPAFSPDGNLVAFRSSRDGGGVFVMRRDGTAVQRLTREGYNPAWSPDGREIAYTTGQTLASPFTANGAGSVLHVVNVQTGVERVVGKAPAMQASWSPHGYRIAYWGEGSVSTCARDGTDVVVAVPASPARSHWNPLWSRDGHHLYFVSNRNGPMHLWRVGIDERTGRTVGQPEQAPVPAPSTFIAHPSFDASGQRLLFASVPMTSGIRAVGFDVVTGAVRGTLEPATTGSLVAVWPEPSPDGRRIAFQTMGDSEEIYVSDREGAAPRLLIGGPGINRCPRWSPDGRRIAFYSTREGRGDIWVVDADGGNLRQVSRSTGAPIIFAAWSPDGRLSASEVSPGRRSFVFDPDRDWDAPGNVSVLPAPERDAQFVPWSWSPDGRGIAGWIRVAGKPAGGVVVFDVGSSTYTRVISEGTQPTPVWLPDGRRLVYAVLNRLHLVDLRTGKARELLNVGSARIEAAAGGGFGVSARGARIYVAPLLRDGDIWFARPRAVADAH